MSKSSTSKAAPLTPSDDGRSPVPLDDKPYVIVIFGRTGVGISSLVNLITGHPISKDHPNAKTKIKSTAHTLRPHPPMRLPRSNSDKTFSLYEVPGFGGQLPDATIIEAIRQIDQKEGIDLFIYCLRKQKNTIIPKIVRRIRAGPEVPMIAVVTELERLEALEGGMAQWWDTSLGDGNTNGTFIEQTCFGVHDTFDAHACVTTLPLKEVALVKTLREQRDASEEQIRRLILDMCTGRKRDASDATDSHPIRQRLSALLRFVSCGLVSMY